MDIEKLIERLSKYSEPVIAYKLDADFAASITDAISELRCKCDGCSVPATTAEMIRDLNDAPKLRAENEKLRAELEKVKEDWSTAVNGLVLMQKKLNKVYRMLYDPLIIVDGGHLRPVKNTSRQQVYKKLVDLQVEMGINRGFPWGEMRMEKKED